jgi:hypothetical protein
VAGSPNRLINHPILRRGQCVEGMVNGGGQGWRGEREEERKQARECSETKKRSTKRHFGITSGKGGQGTLLPDTLGPSRWKERRTKET